MTKFLSLEGLTTLIAKLKSYFAAKGEAIKGITGSGNRVISYIRADNTTGWFNYQDTTYTAGQGIKIVDNTISVQVDSTLFVVVTSLPDAPASGNEGKIHLVPMSKTSTNNKYAEYIWRGTTDKWEQLGTISSKMDLSDYSTTEQVKALIKTETDARTAADTALGNRISALEGDEDVFAGTVGPSTSMTTSFSGYWLATDKHKVCKVTSESPDWLATRGSFLFNDTATGDWYIVDTGKSTTKVQTSITDSEITALFS